MKIAVITGASSGLGRECLEQLREESALPVRVFPLDLAKEESLNELRQELRKHKPDVRLLINGAGFGKIGDDREIS